MSLPRLTITSLLVCLVSSLAVAEAPRLGTPIHPTKIPKEPTRTPTVPIDALLDAMYDYEVWTAPDVTGQTEFVIWGRMADTGQWEEVHRFDWTGSVDHGGWSATQAAENLMDDGEITDYWINQQAKQPQWELEETFDTHDEAEAFADDFEDWSRVFGNPHITDIRPILVNDLLATPTKTSLTTR